MANTVFKSDQLAASPGADKVLQTDGTSNSWVDSADISPNIWKTLQGDGGTDTTPSSATATINFLSGTNTSVGVTPGGSAATATVTYNVDGSVTFDDVSISDGTYVKVTRKAASASSGALSGATATIQVNVPAR